jgi:hypothetical protein
MAARTYSRCQEYPAEHLREELVRACGLSRDDHERRTLRTFSYQFGVAVREGASADAIAKAILNWSAGQASRDEGMPRGSFRR